MHEVSDFQVEILVNHEKSILCKAIDKDSVCCLPTYPRKLAFWLLLSEFWAGSFRLGSFRFSLPGL